MAWDWTNVQDVLMKYGLQPKYLELELTERLALGDC